jgi:DNA-binding NarL/FixJ family response regulator
MNGMPRMKVQEIAMRSVESDFSYQSPATIVDDLSMRGRNDLSCGTWNSENSQQLNCHSLTWTGEGACLQIFLRRVLVVDDYEPFRRFICSTLGEKPELQIVGQVSDGLQAVQTAKELQPDLIVLDIGLTSVNGIEAARRIRRVSPASKILFLSQESSADVVRESLGLGAQGYVVKADAGSELLTAVDAVLRGERFIGHRFSGYDFSGPSDDRSSKDLRSSVFFAPKQQTLDICHHHEVGFFSDDQHLLNDFARFVGAALKAGNAAIVVATESHRDSLLRKLQATGLDVRAAIEQGRYIPLDAAETVSTFMVNGVPDPGKFFEVTGSLIAEATKAVKVKPVRVVACGECAPLLWSQGNPEAAIRLEHLWDEIAQSNAVDVLCGYPAGFRDSVGNDVLNRICAEHSTVYSS